MAAAPQATDDERKSRRSDRTRSRKAPETTCRVKLEHGRWRHLGWAVFGMVAGALLILELGVVAQWLGVGLLVLAAWSFRGFLLTIVRPPGAIVLEEDQLVLPRGVCRGEAEFSPSQLKHAFFLRRAVPWTRAGPVLIVEADDQIFAYPRDWFASESDQRRVASVLNRRLGRT